MDGMFNDSELNRVDKFEIWLSDNRERLNYINQILGGTFDRKLDSSEAFYKDYSDNLCDIKQEVENYVIISREYWQDWLAEQTAEMFKEWGGNMKTILDLCKNMNSVQKSVYERINAMLSTIDFNGSQIQSKLRKFGTK